MSNTNEAYSTATTSLSLDQLTTAGDAKQESATSKDDVVVVESSSSVSAEVAPTNKENSPNVAVASIETKEKDDMKRPAVDTIAEIANKKAKKEEEILDLAVTLGYKAGDRFQVQWEIDQPEAPQEEPIVKWWGATLQEFDGRSTDNVAIRVLKYDPYPEQGFDEPSLEDVVFLGDSLLSSPDSVNQLNYRREGEDSILWMNEDDMDEQLNAILMGALAKNEAAWKSLPAAQQAVIAEQIKIKKEELLKVLKSKKEVITSSSIKDILQETFGQAS